MSDKVGLNDEVRLQNELTFDEYKNAVGNKIAVARIKNDVLMTAKQIAKLYGVSRPYVSIKLNKLYRLGVLNKKSVSNILSHRAEDGKLYETRYYDATAIVAVGVAMGKVEVDSFRRWLDVGDIHKTPKE